MKPHLANLLAVAGVAGVLASCAPFNVTLPVSPGSPEDTNACGPLTGQMVMAGYPSPPSPAGGCVQTQNDVYLAIQAAKVEAAWDTDPAGLRAALAGLCPPPGGSWSVFANTDAATVMHSVAYYITQNRYPVAALLNTTGHAFSTHQEHWVAIKGIGTDVDPTGGTPETLEYVWFVDPAVAVGDPAVERYVAAGTWFTQFQAVTKPGSAYLGKFVAVIEPPPKTGRVRFRPEVVSGNVIPERLALRAAAKWVRGANVEKLGPYRELARAKPLPPILVDAERGGYYLVPYSPDGKQARFAFLVNAYTGHFQEVGAFAPTRFLSAEAAQKLALAAVGGKPASVRSEAISSPEDGASRYRPLWRVWVDGRPVDVTQSGEVFPNRVKGKQRPTQPRN
jgi:hypothetical protein